MARARPPHRDHPYRGHVREWRFRLNFLETASYTLGRTSPQAHDVELAQPGRPQVSRATVRRMRASYHAPGPAGPDPPPQATECNRGGPMSRW
jgi:hypothetical protein